MQPVLELRHLTKHFGAHCAVDDVSLEVPSGGFYSLLGPSGCGKTTTLRLIAGFEQPDSGEVLLSGERVETRRPYERNVSTVFQNYALFPHLSVRANVGFGLQQRSERQTAARVDRILEVLGLASMRDRFPSQLSGGERQRTALARSLVLEPRLLLLDEPLAALDENLRRQMRLELKDLQRRVGIAFLMVTHDREEALSLSDRITVMNCGRIEQTGTPEEVYLKPGTRFVAGFLGALNWIGGVALRPESLRLLPGPPIDGWRSRPATVARTVFLGNCLQVRARLEGGEEVLVESPRLDERCQTGQSVHVAWRAEDEMSFPE